MKPTIGRIVHYYPDDPRAIERKPDHQPNAAIITRINGNGTVNLWVFPTGETVSKQGIANGIKFGDPATDRAGKLWCWPPREGGAEVASITATSPEEAAAKRAAQDGGTVESIAEEAAAATDAEKADGDTVQLEPD